MVCMHIRSSSRMPGTTPDAPFIVSSVLTFSNAMGSLLDYVVSGTLGASQPHARVLGGSGRVDAVRARAHGQALARALRHAFGSSLREPPTTYIRIASSAASSTTRVARRAPHRHGHDLLRDLLHHADSTFPHSEKVRATSAAGRPERRRDHKLLRNAIRVRARAFRHQRVGRCGSLTRAPRRCRPSAGSRQRRPRSRRRGTRRCTASRRGPRTPRRGHGRAPRSA